MRRISFLIVLLFSFGHLVLCQTIIGYIKDSETKEPLESVSIYYDGTTIGAVSKENGAFEISSEVTTNAVVVISYLGYETRYLSQSEVAEAETIFLIEKPESLDAVVIEADDWSREKKMKIFKREFLGKGEAAKDCKILNEDAVQLVYMKSKNTLYAYAEVPIKIQNKYLGYSVNYNIVDFEVKFVDSLSDYPWVENVYYAGTSNFTELNKNRVKRKYKKARESIYHGSALEFMRALSKKDLEAHKFTTFIKKDEKDKFILPVDPYKFLEVNRSSNANFVITIKTDKLYVMYNMDVQSALIPKEDFHTFYIDDYGIHTPPDKLLFSGAFGRERIGRMLPLNYDIEPSSE